MSGRIAIAALVVGACTSSSPERPPSGELPPKVDPPAKSPGTATREEDGMELTWTLSGGGETLVVDYTLRNQTDKKVWVAARLLQNTAGGRVMKPVDRLIVRNGDAPELVSFVRGMTYESLPGGRERPAPSPEMVGLEPGASLTGRAEVPLPLVAWHNYGAVPALEGDKTKAVLELTYIDDPDDDKAWWQVPLDDGTRVRAPNPYHLKKSARRISSRPLPLP